MPASPEISTVWPSPAQARRWRAISSALSASRPTKPVRRADCAASNRLSLSDTQPPGRRRQDNAARVGEALQPRGEIGRVADDHLLLRGALADDVAGDDEAGRDPDSYGELFEGAGLQSSHRFGDVQGRMDRARSVVLVRAGKAEGRQNPVAEEFCHEPLIASQHARA